WLRCSSLTYSRYARSSRLAIRAPRSGTYATNHRYGTLKPDSGGPLLRDRQHPLEGDPRPVLAVVGDDDPIVHLAVDEPFEDPEQMIRRDAEHGRAQAADLVEREDRPVGIHLARKTVDEMNF